VTIPLRASAQSGGVYEAASTQQAAQRAAASAGFIGLLVGGILALSGIITLFVGGVTVAMGGSEAIIGSAVTLGIGGILTAVGIAVFLGARAKGKRAAWLRTNGLPVAMVMGRELRVRANPNKLDEVIPED
jgi:hypothetical protein